MKSKTNFFSNLVVAILLGIPYTVLPDVTRTDGPTLSIDILLSTNSGYQQANEVAKSIAEAGR